MPRVILDPRKRPVRGDTETEALASVILEADMRKVKVRQPVRGVKSEDE
jgi:hypothetical protein